ncbi:dihydrofolate reductase family protein [Saccharopolyspora mangrovi]|uniref:Dihydrofolate reductase family protein n=1 Tax=Saccharopolyspora mangrovi TaxID=3082379 RepID=A0ABU6AEY8_9PSEU|nr:dihydrofolate reductase family protein [Saccharopolyspora sp. S2-29]MEB3370085.1 dihydrofolate reductase family protein [Saccharopolyspora sp. S2-29]
MITSRAARQPGTAKTDSCTHVGKPNIGNIEIDADGKENPGDARPPGFDRTDLKECRMGRITYVVMQSLDGYIEGPNGEFDWPVMDSELAKYSQEFGDTADVFLYGRVVWDGMSSYWPRAEEYSDHPHDLEFAPVWRAKPKVVVSRTLKTADWNTTVVNDITELAEIKQDKHLVLYGGAELAATLTEHRLIDEYQVFVHPVLLGGGKPVLPSTKVRSGLRLVESRTFDSQVVMLRHELAADR